MQFYNSLATALGLAAQSIRAHKLRSFLTLLGIIIGVGSVVIVGAAIEGLGTYAETTTSKVFGSDAFQIGQLLIRGQLTRKQVIEKLRYNRRIRQEDYTYLKSVTGDRILYSPYRQRADDIKAGSLIVEDAVVIGTAAAMSEIRDIDLTEGRFYTEREERSRVPVAVIGEEIRATLFPTTSAVGQTIKIGGFDFLVVGVQEKVGSAGGQSQDKVLYIPDTVYERLYGTDRSLLLFARPRPDSGLRLEEALDVARVALRNRYKARPGAEDNFDTLTPDSIKEFIGNILRIISAAAVPITSISLIVGGIVIMNIMLVSVTERTREIGIRKSLGARQFDLMLQFLMEALILAITGGLIGLAGATLLTKLASLASGFDLHVTAPYVILALLVSTITGVVAGWYPARRAARLDPIEALRAD